MDSISTIFKLEMMKIPMETKALRWEEYYEQVSREGRAGGTVPSTPDRRPSTSAGQSPRPWTTR
jgi:hypothetical protein